MLESYTFCGFVHFFQEEHHLGVVSELRVLYDEGGLLDLGACEVIFPAIIIFVLFDITFKFIRFFFISMFFISFAATPSSVIC